MAYVFITIFEAEPPGFPIAEYSKGMKCPQST